MHAFWLVHTYDLLEDRRIDDVIIKTLFNSLLYKTNRFQVAMHLFSNRSQRMSKCGKNISDTLGCASCATFLFLPHFDVICDLLLNRRTATWNLFVNYIISSVMHAFWLVLTYDLLEDRRTDEVIIKTFFPFILILYYIKQIDSKLPCVCSVIDHRGRQNVVRTSVTHSAAPHVPLFCSYHTRPLRLS